jgi:hypothetical protein
MHNNNVGAVGIAWQGFWPASTGVGQLLFSESLCQLLVSVTAACLRALPYLHVGQYLVVTVKPLIW